MSKIILKCVNESGKLRIRFHCFINNETGEIYRNSYNNTYNCQFPKNIRTLNTYYEIPSQNLSLSMIGQTYFYKVKNKNIVILDHEPDLNNMINTSQEINFKVFTVEECVCCMDKVPDVVITGCGHQCLCEECSIKLTRKICPICRDTIKGFIKI